jgi:1,4-dihydroxy-2-naphthoate polyprenyltransferase
MSNGLIDADRPIDGPSPALAGPGTMAAIRRGFLATRPPFLIAAVAPVVAGTAWAGVGFHRFDGLTFGLALAAMLLAHAAANVYNDVGDDITGADPGNLERIYPYTGGSRFIQSGLLSRSEMTRLAAGLAAAALLLGALLALVRGPGVIWLGCAGLGLGLLYSLPGVQLSARGLGEATVAIAFGVLPVLGSVWLQTGFVDLGALLLSLPVSAWAAAILIINEVPDIDADRRAQKYTLVVRWGVSGARWIYRSLVLLALAASAAAILERMLPLWYSLPALVFTCLGLQAARGISADRTRRARLKRSIELTLAMHAIGCTTLITAILLGPRG